MSDTKSDIEKIAGMALSDDSVYNQLVEALNGKSRRNRQNAAAALADIARIDPKRVAPNADDLVDALDRDEARTRWEALDALTEIISVNSRSCDKAIDGAESALFDEDSGPLRLSAMRFLCKLGSTTENRSEKVWPLIDEGIQCYHGDLEFGDMTSAITEFSLGNLSDNVKDALVDRVSFDATSGKGPIKKHAEIIVKNIRG